METIKFDATVLDHDGGVLMVVPSDTVNYWEGYCEHVVDLGIEYGFYGEASPVGHYNDVPQSVQMTRFSVGASIVKAGSARDARYVRERLRSGLHGSLILSFTTHGEWV